MKTGILMLAISGMALVFLAYTGFTSSYFYDTEKVTITLQVYAPQSSHVEVEKLSDCPFNHCSEYFCVRLKNTGDASVTLVEIEGESLQKLIALNGSGGEIYDSSNEKHSLSITVPPFFSDEDYIYLALKFGERCSEKHGMHGKDKEHEDKHDEKHTVRLKFSDGSELKVEFERGD
ncbi:hypothetical protein [Geoglobus acetivorans]|uniref:Uncharacterized protein n=1 Tax=Geoglobus acetivorans TaxID=565033 RepID=A0A0A7GDA9_GEOAI|nr:hypothetical protein GACE_0739 [Geoglobus acetivorans]